MTGSTYLGATTDTWVKILFPMLAATIVGALAWSFRVESRLGHAATRDFCRAAVLEHAKEHSHRGAASDVSLQALRRRVETNEKSDVELKSMIKSILTNQEEIKREIRMIRRGERR